MDRVLWATAFYAGLRRGELQALRWVDVDLAGGVLRVESSWDVKAGVIDPKVNRGRRKVPIAAILRDYLVQHRIAAGDGLVFGRADGTPFATSTISKRASEAWRAARLDPITLHECRHTGPLWPSVPGSEGEAAVLLDAYLAESHERARSASRPGADCGEVGGKDRPLQERS